MMPSLRFLLRPALLAHLALRLWPRLLAHLAVTIVHGVAHAGANVALSRAASAISAMLLAVTEAAGAALAVAVVRNAPRPS